jgi:hypothetical protein
MCNRGGDKQCDEYQSFNQESLGGTPAGQGEWSILGLFSGTLSLRLGSADVRNWPIAVLRPKFADSRSAAPPDG